MTRLQVALTAVARRHVQAIDKWWRMNRREAPTLFFDELSSGINQLAVAPRYHIYYWVSEATGEVRVRAVWHAARGHGPRL